MNLNNLMRVIVSMDVKDFDFMYNKSGLSRGIIGFLTNDKVFRDLFEKKNKTNNWARSREELIQLIYEIVCEIYFPLKLNKKSLSDEDTIRAGIFGSIIKSISKVLFDDKNAWQQDYYEKYHPLGFLLKESTLPKKHLIYLMEKTYFVNAFEDDNDYTNSMEDLNKKIYQITCNVFFPMKKEYDLIKNKRGNKYKNFLEALDSFSLALFDDSSYWKNDYEKYLKEGDTNE